MDRDSSQMQAKLAALADGTLAPQERARLLDQVGAHPELADDLEAQRQALGALATLESARAPERLYRSVEALATAAPRAKSSPRRMRLQLALAGSLVAAAAVAIAIATSSPSRPTVLQAADAALGSPTLPPPQPSTTRRGQLARSVDGIAYPYWQDSLGWAASGARTDSVDRRTVTTVYYTREGGTDSASSRVGYAIVGGNALPRPGGGTIIQAHGIKFQALRMRDAMILTWRRAGHTCILVGRGVSTATLVHLASWE